MDAAVAERTFAVLRGAGGAVVVVVWRDAEGRPRQVVVGVNGGSGISVGHVDAESP